MSYLDTTHNEPMTLPTTAPHYREEMVWQSSPVELATYFMTRRRLSTM